MVTVLKFEEDRDEYPVFILIELLAEPVNDTAILGLRDYFNSPEPYEGISRSSPANLTIFKPTGMRGATYICKSINNNNNIYLDVCYCNVPLAVSDGTDDSQIRISSLFDIVDVCIGPAVSPCICDTAVCRVSITNK